MGRRFRVWLFAVGAMLAGAAPALGATMPPSRAMSVLTSASEPTLTNETVAGANVFTFLATPSSGNFASALTGETGSGGVVFSSGPTIALAELTTPHLSGGSADGFIVGETTPAAGTFTTINGTTPSTFGRSLWDDADATAGRNTLGASSGIWSVALGGTGRSTITSGAILKGAGTSAVADATAGSDFADPGTIRVVHKDGTETTYQASADTAAARGTAAKTAAAALVAYDAAYVGPGDYDLGASQLRTSQFPSNVAWIGGGIGPTYFVTTYSGAGMVIEPGSGNVLRGFTLDCTLTDGSWAKPIGNVGTTAAAATGVILDGVRIVNPADAVYAAHATNVFSCTAYNCQFDTAWDNIAFQGAAHSFIGYNCSFAVTSPARGQTYDSVHNIYNVSGTVKLYGGNVATTFTSNASPFLTSPTAIQSTGTLELYGVALACSNTSGGGDCAAVRVNGGTATLVGNALSGTMSSSDTFGVLDISAGTTTIAGGSISVSGSGGKTIKRSAGTVTAFPNVAMDWGLTSGTITYGPLASSKVTVNAAANSSAIVSTGYSLTGSNAQSLVDLTGTWNTTGNPVAIFANITNTASGSTARLVDLKVNGSTVFAIEKSGTASIGGGQIKDSGSGQLGIGGSIGENYYASANSFQITGSKALSFGVNYGTSDVFVYRDAANVLAQRNGANGQELRVYGADGASTADEYVSIAATTSGDTIEAAKAATGTYRDLTIKSGGVSTLRSTTAGELTALVGLNYPVANKTSTFTATAAERTFFCDATSAPITANLPAAASYTGRVYIIVKTDSSGNAVTIDPAASETLNGSLTQAIAAQYGVWQIQSNGTNWFKIN